MRSFALAVGVSLAVHAAIGGVMSRIEKRGLGQAQQAVTVAIVEVPKPAEPPKPEPPKAKPPPPPPKPIKLARAPKALPPPPVVPPPQPVPPQNAPPPPSVEAKTNTNAPIETGITMESTAQNGSFAVGVGNTLYGTPSTTAKDPASVKPYKAERYASIATVTEMPHIISKPNVREFYPHEAERKDFEGDVVLRILVDSDGTVAKAEIVTDPGEGLGAAALRMFRTANIRFEPAKQNGVAVATSFNFTVHFTLN